MKRQHFFEIIILAAIILSLTGCGKASESKEGNKEAGIQSKKVAEKTDNEENEANVDGVANEDTQPLDQDEDKAYSDITVQASETADVVESEHKSDKANEQGLGQDKLKDSYQENGLDSKTPSPQPEPAPAGLLTSASDIKLVNTDGKGSNYSFTYNGEEFSAIYTTDNWKIVDSYKINEEADMMIICQALIDEHPIHGSDMVSYRTADDMVYEWIMHNMAYAFISDDETLRKKAKDVDFDPEDQGKSFDEIYKSRTGKELDLNSILEQ